MSSIIREKVYIKEISSMKFRCKLCVSILPRAIFLSKVLVELFLETIMVMICPSNRNLKIVACIDRIDYIIKQFEMK